jgi:MoaA/NifB/PqqE/SkfB family radical SAM enzyme
MCLTHSTKFSNPYGQKPTKDMDFDLFKQVLHRYKNALGVNIIGNGEPLLHRDFFKMVDYAANVMKMNVFSSSNGLLVGKYIEEITNSPLKNFNISLNGHNSVEFHRVTGMSPELFSQIRDNTVDLVTRRKEKSAKLRVTACFILDLENHRYLEEMISFADSLGVDRIAFFHFLPVQMKGFTSEERCLFSDNASVEETFAKVDSLPKRIKQKVTLPPLLDRGMNRNKYCGVWFQNLSIDGEGNVGGCSCQILDLTLSGRFSDGSDPWNNAYFREMRKRFIDRDYPLLEPCTWCYNNTSYLHDRAKISNLLFSRFRRLRK